MTTARLLTTALSAFPLLLAACAPADTVSDTGGGARFNVVSTLPAGSFGAAGESGFSGDLYVRGHAEIVTVDEPFCEEDCREFEYAFFEIDETGNEALEDFLSLNEGNAYVRPSAVGLGCVEDGIVHYNNQSDGRQMVEISLDAAASQAILASSIPSPVTLHLTKLPLSGGTEAPVCYSHFTTIRLAEEA